ncbi:hypothetical protein GBF38_009291, partial [Nibea albiflora]
VRTQHKVEPQTRPDRVTEENLKFDHFNKSKATKSSQPEADLRGGAARSCEEQRGAARRSSEEELRGPARSSEDLRGAARSYEDL